MAVEDAVLAALLVALAGSLSLLSAVTFRRYRKRNFLLLTAGFAAVLAEGIVLSLVALDLARPGGPSLSIVAGAQVVALLLIYAATLSKR
jgi:hypothetical protein